MAYQEQNALGIDKFYRILVSMLEHNSVIMKGKGTTTNQGKIN